MTPFHRLACHRALVDFIRGSSTSHAAESSVLLLDPEPDVEALARAEFTGANIRVERNPSHWLDETKFAPPYDYIFVGHRRGTSGQAQEELLPALTRMLAADGVCYIGVPGIAGYTAPAMINAAARLLDREDTSSRAPRARDIIRDHIPETHLFAMQRPHLRLPMLDETDAVGRVFSVSSLLTTVADSGAKFLDWVLPWLYKPEYMIADKNLREKMSVLPRRIQAAVVELAMAFPSEHHLFLCRSDYDPPRHPELDPQLLDRIPKPVGEEALDDLRLWLPEMWREKAELRGEEGVFLKEATGEKNIHEILGATGLLSSENERKKREFVLKLVDFRVITF